MDILSADIVLLLLLVSGYFVAWNTGANDAANCIGAAVGAGVMSFRWAAIMLGIMVFLGAMLAGDDVMGTTGGDMVITTAADYESHHGSAPDAETASLLEGAFPDGRVPDLALIAALLAAGVSVLIATYSALPLSTSQSIVGSVSGAGIGMVGLRPELFDLSLLLNIGGSWVLSPFLTLLIGYIGYSILVVISKRIKRVFVWEKTLATFVLLSSAFFAFSLGSNAFGAGLGPLAVRLPEHIPVLAASAGVVLGIGAYTFGSRVTRAVGEGITSLDYAGAFAAQFAAGFGLQFFSQWGIPVSSSQAIVGAIVGVGLVKGATMVSGTKVLKIFASWVFTPAFAAVLSVLLLRGLTLVF